MKVVHFIDTLRSGGKERQLVELLKGLSNESDINCELIILSSKIHYSDLRAINIPIHRFERERKKDYSIFLKLFLLLKEIRPDIIHTWNSMCSVYAIPSVKLLNIKFVNGFLRNASPKLKADELLRSKITFPFSDVILSNSKAGLEAYNAPRSKSRYIHNGYDCNRICNLSSPNSIRANLQIQTPFVVGMVGSFSQNKDYQMFFEAAKMLLSNRNDVTFIAIGDGEQLQQCKNSIPDNMKSRVKFLGKVKDVESIVQIFTIGVLCSTPIHGEGISNAIMEYMALEKPVIATESGGNRELIVNGETGELINVRDPKELYLKLRYFLNNREVVKRYGIKGKERLIRYFSLAKMTQNHNHLYGHLVETISNKP